MPKRTSVLRSKEKGMYNIRKNEDKLIFLTSDGLISNLHIAETIENLIEFNGFMHMFGKREKISTLFYECILNQIVC